jgi:hypothetical protein
MCFRAHKYACKRLHSGESACSACIDIIWLRSARRIKTVLAAAGSGTALGKMPWRFGALRRRIGGFRRPVTSAFARTAPANALQLAQKCKGSRKTMCKGCHGTEQRGSEGTINLIMRGVKPGPPAGGSRSVWHVSYYRQMIRKETYHAEWTQHRREI